MSRFILVFFILLLTIGANLSDGFLARLGIDPDVLVVTLVSLAITGLIAYRRLALVVVAVFLAIGANLPEGTALAIGLDPDFLLAALVTLVVMPYASQIFGKALWDRRTKRPIGLKANSTSRRLSSRVTLLLDLNHASCGCSRTAGTIEVLAQRSRFHLLN